MPRTISRKRNNNRNGNGVRSISSSLSATAPEFFPIGKY